MPFPLLDIKHFLEYAVYRRSFSVSVDNGLIFKTASRVSWRLRSFFFCQNCLLFDIGRILT